MSFDEGGRIDAGRASRGGGLGGGGIAIGGGAGGLVLLVLALVFGVPVGDLTGDGGTSGPAPGAGEGFEQCRTGADANTDVDCRIIATAESLDAVWEAQLPTVGVQYTQPDLVIFTQQVGTACGSASASVGPFYCPADSTVYLDSGFFDVLREQFGASGGPLAEEYVVAHEFGHHIQNQLGVIGRGQADPQGPESGAVRVELMADCLAGVWAHHATTTPDPDTGEPLLLPLTDADIADALSAASAVGDDRIQESTQGQVNPEAWTHGSAEQRRQWFLVGYDTGTVDGCDTFAADL